MTTESIICKVWGFCRTLRDDGEGYELGHHFAAGRSWNTDLNKSLQALKE